MTPGQRYWQQWNTASRKYGGPICCPECETQLEIPMTDDGLYHCAPCGWYWNAKGEVVELDKELSDA